jgi:23S rRNA (uridine2552-2'-O)-methyltransferase
MKSSRSKSSKEWLARHVSDPYVQQARAEGWRSRAVYKLQEISKKTKLIRPGMNIVDLGAAPGGWSQYAASRLQEKGRVFALDILPMSALPGVTFIQGDFREQSVFDHFMAALDGEKIQLVMSDMAPNLSGHKAVDQPKLMHLVELAHDFASRVLKKDGYFLVKLFHGAGFQEYIKILRADFSSVSVYKPEASRRKSREVYALARR